MSNKETPKKPHELIKADLTAPVIAQKIQEAVPETLRKYLTPDRMAKVALMAISKNSKLLDCSRMSIVEAVVESASLGLEFGDTLGHAYLVPYKDKARLQIGYRGLLDLARRSGQITSVVANVVYENDTFKINLGDGEPPYHVPANGERGKAVAAYCTARFKDGGHHVEYMTRSDIERIRSYSKTADREDGPWKTAPEAMWKKTVIRSASKYWPRAVQFVRALEAESSYDAPVSANVVDVEYEERPASQPRTRQIVNDLAQRQGVKTILVEDKTSILDKTPSYQELMDLSDKYKIAAEDFEKMSGEAGISMTSNEAPTEDQLWKLRSLINAKATPDVGAQ